MEMQASSRLFWKREAETLPTLASPSSIGTRLTSLRPDTHRGQGRGPSLALDGHTKTLLHFPLSAAHGHIWDLSSVFFGVFVVES